MTTAESIRAMKGSGASYRAIAAHLGVNDSLVGQIARGAKPGENLEARAAALRARMDALGSLPPVGQAGPLPEAPRRAQRVRQAIRRGGTRWSTATAKDQATRSGARQLESIITDARATGRRVSLNLQVDPRIQFAKSPGRRKRGGHGHRAAQEVRIGDAGRGLSATALESYVQAHDGDVRAGIAAYLSEAGYAEHVPADAIQRIEISTWDG